MKIDVIEVNQFASGEHMEKKNFDNLTEDIVKREAQDIVSSDVIGSGFARKTVDENEECRWGHVWYIKGKDGKLKHWKANYDTSG
jgi:hypothetical protein